MEQSKSLGRTASENILLYPGMSGTRRRTRNSSKKIRWISFSHTSSSRLNARWWGSQKGLLWTVTGELIHFLFRWSTSTSPERHVHHWTYCWRKILKITGTWMEEKNCQMHGQASQDSFYWTKGHLTDIHGPGRDLQGNKTTSRPDDVWPDMWKHVWCSEKESKTKMGYLETKARQCLSIERGILHWTKRRRFQAHNESRS